MKKLIITIIITLITLNTFSQNIIKNNFFETKLISGRGKKYP